MQRKYTVIKDSFDARDHYAMPSTQTLPLTYSNAEFLGPVKDQGQAGSCTGNAGAGCRETLYRQFLKYEKFNTIPVGNFQLSALFLYAMERILDGDFSQDAGSDSRTLMKVLAKNGCCLESQDPYSDKNIFVMPTATQVAEAIDYSNISYHRIPDLNTAKSVIASGYSFVIGMPVYNGLESQECASTGNLPLPAANEQPIGGHEVLIYGYDDTWPNLDGSKGAFLVRNSWGSDWGVNGNFYLPYSYFTIVGLDNFDLWVMHLGKPWPTK